MKNHQPGILTLYLLFMLPLSAVAQSPSIEPTARSVPTPTPEKSKTAPQSQPSPELELEFGASYESLSNDKPDWQSYFIRFKRKFTSGQALYGEASAVTRFNQTDPNFMIGLYQPLNQSKQWFATFEAAGSPNHQVLPVISLFGQLGHNFGAGWIGTAGFRHNHYSADKVNMGVFGVEKYFKAYRGAYTLFVAHLNGSGASTSHVFQGNYYYGERSSVGAGVAFGQEIESVGNGQFIRSDVREVSLIGRHWINQRWGLSYVALWHRQGTFYTRSGAQVGVLLRF